MIWLVTFENENGRILVDHGLDENFNIVILPQDPLENFKPSYFDERVGLWVIN